MRVTKTLCDKLIRGVNRAGVSLVRTFAPGDETATALIDNSIENSIARARAREGEGRGGEAAARAPEPDG